MTTRQARTIARETLDAMGFSNPITARRVSFLDLARGDAIFITVKDWRADPRAGQIKDELRAHDLRVSFTGPGIIG